MICSHCATEMPDISAYCPKCGHSVSQGPHEEDHSGPTLVAADLKEAVLGALSYFAVVPAIVMLAIPGLRGKPFIRFHAWQSILFTAATVIIALAMRIIFSILSFVPFVGSLFAWLSAGLVFLALVMLWAILVVKTGQGEGYELPWLGHLVSRLTAPRAG